MSAPSANIQMQPQRNEAMVARAPEPMQEVSLEQQTEQSTEAPQKKPSLWMRGGGVIGDCVDAIVCFECCKGCCDCCC